MGVLRKKIYRSFKNYPRYRKMSLYVEYCILDAQNEQYYTQWIENDIILKWMEIASRIQICKKLWIQNAPQFWGLLVSLFCGFGFYLQFPLIFQFHFMLKVPNIEIHGAFWAFFLADFDSTRDLICAPQVQAPISWLVDLAQQNSIRIYFNTRCPHRVQFTQNQM